jgi:hypothetical protein
VIADKSFRRNVTPYLGLTVSKRFDQQSGDIFMRVFVAALAAMLVLSSGVANADGKSRAWCGWFMRQQVGADLGSTYNLARNWAHWGHAANAGIGAIVVWLHHVGQITGGSPGHWIVTSGNDGNRVRTRELSVTRAIAFREGGGFEPAHTYAFSDVRERRRSRRQEVYLNRNRYAGADTWARPDYH